MVYPERKLDSRGEVWRIVEHLQRLAALRRPPIGMIDADAYRGWLLRQIDGLRGLSESIEETNVLMDAQDRVAFANKEDLWREYTRYTQDTGQNPSDDREILAGQISEAEDRLNVLRASRNQRIKADYAEGTSKYRLAKDWRVSGSTIDRIVTRVDRGITPAAERASIPREEPAHERRERQEEDVFEKFFRENPDDTMGVLD